MDYSELIRSDTEAAQRTQERYGYFLISLIFTTLAFSIQTTTTEGPPLRIAFELLAWLSLFLSGLLGLARWRYLPGSYAYSTQLLTLTENIEKTRELKSRGNEMIDTSRFGVISANDFIAKNTDAIHKLEQKRDKLDKRLKMLAIAHRVFLLLGFVSLMVSRGYEHFHVLMHSLVK